MLYFLCTGTPHKYILRTLCSILQEAVELHLEGTMTAEVDGEEHPITIIPEILIRAQVLRLKGVDTKDFDKLPWHVKKNILYCPIITFIFLQNIVKCPIFWTVLSQKTHFESM